MSSDVIVVERSFQEPLDLAALQAQEDAQQQCLDTHRVRFVGTYVAGHQRNMVCVYDAPDAEAVRVTQDRAGLPYDRIWAATSVFGHPIQENPHGEIVVVPRSWPRALTPADVRHMLKVGADCLERARITLVASILAHAGRRQFCVYAARDTDSVRRANDEGGAPYEDAWRATVHRA